MDTTTQPSAADATTIQESLIEGFDKIIPGGGFSNILGFGLQLGLAIAFITCIYAGFLYITSAGNPSKQKEAIEWLKAAVIGIMVIAGGMIIINTLNPSLIN